MPAVEVRGLFKGFGKNMVLKNVSFSVADGEYVMVLGPSGCGKTTLLKTMAGLYRPNVGRIFVGGKDVTSLPPEERDIGFFFQHYHLFPHMTVAENVGYGLSVKGAVEAEVRKAVSEKLRLVGLLEWADHMPYELSGGMQQRVALARALAVGSKLLLLDEPLNALDAKIAALLRGELKRMAKDLGLTVLHVTPNQAEAMELADRLIILRDGKVIQEGTDIEVYLRPNSTYSAYFLGESNFLRARRVDAHTFRYRHRNFRCQAEVPEDDVIVAVRCEKIRFESHEQNSLEGVIESVNFLGYTTHYDVDQKGRHIHVETSKHPALKAGDEVSMYFPPEDLMVFPSSLPLDDDIEVM
jgi:ABC-type Fe3+/spermidine/putrescine transport system ATPase subunit